MFPNLTFFWLRLQALISFFSVPSSPHLLSSAPSSPHFLLSTPLSPRSSKVACFLTLPPFKLAFKPSTIKGSAFPNPTLFRVRLRVCLQTLTFYRVCLQVLIFLSSAHLSSHLRDRAPLSPIMSTLSLFSSTWVGHPLQLNNFIVFSHLGRSPVIMRPLLKKMNKISLCIFHHWAGHLKQLDHSWNLFRVLFFIGQVAWNN
jgi:hypothetical protein